MSTMNQLSLEHAYRIIAGALEKSKACGYKPMAIAVLDAAGQPPEEWRAAGLAAMVTAINRVSGVLVALFGLAVLVNLAWKVFRPGH